MQNNNDVKKIIQYLQGKIDNLKRKKAEYDSPMMQDMVKNSPHYQVEYSRLCIELQVNEDNLLAIKTFTAEPTTATAKKPKIVKKKAAPDAKKD